MKKEYCQLQFLEYLTKYQHNNSKSELLKKYYPSISSIFDYFFQCLNVTRNLQKEHTTDNYATEIEIIDFVLQSAANKLDKNWLQHRKNCPACNHTYEVYSYLINNIRKILAKQKQLLLINLILVYLHN